VTTRGRAWAAETVVPPQSMGEDAAAMYLGIQYATLRKLRRNGKPVPAFVVCKQANGRERIRYTQTALDEWKDSQ
jgi:hypothetical protein